MFMEKNVQRNVCRQLITVPDSLFSNVILQDQYRTCCAHTLISDKTLVTMYSDDCNIIVITVIDQREVTPGQYLEWCCECNVAMHLAILFLYRSSPHFASQLYTSGNVQG